MHSSLICEAHSCKSRCLSAHSLVVYCCVSGLLLVWHLTHNVNLRVGILCQALRFTRPIQDMGQLLVDRMRAKGGRYIALHLRCGIACQVISFIHSVQNFFKQVIDYISTFTESIFKITKAKRLKVVLERRILWRCVLAWPWNVFRFQKAHASASLLRIFSSCICHSLLWTLQIWIRYASILWVLLWWRWEGDGGAGCYTQTLEDTSCKVVTGDFRWLE